MKATAINVGDKVAYSAAFCRSIGEYTGDIPHARGIVKSIKSYTDTLKLVEIEWDREGIPGRVHIDNLSKVGSREFSAQ